MDKLEFFMLKYIISHFLQDGAHCHTFKIVKTLFAERPHIQLLKWSANNPDLNLIENIWYWMKMKLNDSTAKNMEE